MKKRIEKFKMLIFMLAFAINFASLHAEEKDSCPEKLIVNYKQQVTNRETASELFTKTFPAEKGFPPFDEKMLIGPYSKDPSVPTGSYSYFGWYGYNEKKVGGLLYPDGRLVQRGYCK